MKRFFCSENPPFFTERWTLLRSKFAKKKYWREYEIRTYYKKFHVNYFFLNFILIDL
jgi:hypothetical protein